ncbi:type I-E CRISPR-associated protein Cas6/Cse3/CasE [Streptomyces viridosporus]|uniref:type I-E CRISPR-associated protein Cas6/Cse3/CasE n=1 Tax=Streptomyces viridosporus TaxID=67581 RepID=UPI0009C19F5C|nr:type I-E CRISPR-associated protein Cas6/Cse3/CasE [Streptomyces viridosporus]
MNDHPVIARIRLNPHSRDVQRDLRDATQMHRTVMRMVPDNLGDAPRQQAGLLYRLEETDTSSTLLPLSGADADQWWLRRATEAGLDLHVLTPTSMEPARPRGQDAPRMRHSLIRYDGTATVTDPHALQNAVLHGIGRGKPYGAGLLSLAPATTA